MIDGIEQAQTYKDKLEISKLHHDISYTKREFLLKLTNTALLVLFAVCGFYFVQRPQIDHLEATRLFAERQHIDNAILGYFNIKELSDRRAYIAVLKNQYPQYAYFGVIEQSLVAVNEKPLSGPNTPPEARCNDLNRLVAELEKSESDLRVQMAAEERGIPTPSNERPKAGRGPVYLLLSRQLEEVAARQSVLKAERSRLRCA